MIDKIKESALMRIAELTKQIQELGEEVELIHLRADKLKLMEIRQIRLNERAALLNSLNK